MKNYYFLFVSFQDKKVSLSSGGGAKAQASSSSANRASSITKKSSTSEHVRKNSIAAAATASHVTARSLSISHEAKASNKAALLKVKKAGDNSVMGHKMAKPASAEAEKTNGQAQNKIGDANTSKITGNSGAKKKATTSKDDKGHLSKEKPQRMTMGNKTRKSVHTTPPIKTAAGEDGRRSTVAASSSAQLPSAANSSRGRGDSSMVEKQSSGVPVQLRRVKEEGGSGSLDNLSTRVNVSSSEGSEGISSPEPEISNNSTSTNDSQRKGTAEAKQEEQDSVSVPTSPVVSDCDAEGEREEEDEKRDEMPADEQQGGGPSNRLLMLGGIAGSRINKRSESDGIVVAERPRPDKPVRRAESTDDATANARGSLQSLAKVASHSPVGSATVVGGSEVPKFKQSIKTVASATIVKGPEDLSLDIGQTAQFRAHYFGNPEPRVVWVRNGVRLRPDGERLLVRTYSGESTLIVRDLRADDSGKYEVLIENEVGCDAAAASLGVEGPPEPPAGRPFVSDVDVDSGQSPSLTLAWYGPTFDGGSCVTGYVVEVASWACDSPSGTPESPDWAVLQADCHSTSYIVESGLVPGREFIFRVRVRQFFLTSFSTLHVQYK